MSTGPTTLTGLAGSVALTGLHSKYSCQVLDYMNALCQGSIGGLAVGPVIFPTGHRDIEHRIVTVVVRLLAMHVATSMCAASCGWDSSFGQRWSSHFPDWTPGH